MALTQTSKDGLKDDVVASDLTGISGSDGTFLQRNAGSASGLEWAAVSIADDSITQAKIADGAVGTDQLATNAVTDAKIANDSVAENQLKTNNDGTHGQYLKKISGGTGGMGWGDVGNITQNTQGSTYTLVAADAGKHILASGTITVPDSVFAAGDAVTIVNNTGSNLTITKTITTMYLSTDASSANRTLATRGMATILFASGTVAYISGAGLT